MSTSVSKPSRRASKLLGLRSVISMRNLFRRSGVLTLPIEIILQIIFYIPTSDKGTLISLTRTSRITLLASEQRLYETLDLEPYTCTWVVFSQLQRLVTHLCSNPRHASMVHHVQGSFYGTLYKVSDVPHGRQFPMLGLGKRYGTKYFTLDKLDILPKHLTHLRTYSSFDRDAFSHYFTQCPTNDMESLTFNSWKLSEMASHVLSDLHFEGAIEHGKRTFEPLVHFVIRQKHLKILRTHPVANIFYQPTDHLPKQPPLLPFSEDQNIESVEGTCWFLTFVLPSTVYPRKLRFWDGMDTFPQSRAIPRGFMDGLKYVRVLSFCFCNRDASATGDQGGGGIPQFLAAFATLPRLEVLELAFSHDSHTSSMRSIISTFASLLPLNITTTNAGLKHLVVTFPFTPHISGKHSLLEAVSDLAFQVIDTLLTVEVARKSEREYLQKTRGEEGGFGSKRKKVVKDNDWWIDA
ncbi:hypothetical protein DL96DRAFT_1684464 [Flagelloscypha sp. PMI_526]|nr:hypothetical protein DL96DRAFT_1684464 [Flagelloscypha sp. PMI_526]